MIPVASRTALTEGALNNAPTDRAASPSTYIAKPTVRVRDGRPIRLLVITSLYPNAEQPRHGVFIEERLRKLIATSRVSATVVAPVPWFPFKCRRFGTYATYARVPKAEERHGIRILHPRYPVIPKIGMNLAPALMYRALLPCVRLLLQTKPGYDMFDAHYLYPDGVAAVAIGRATGRPVVLSARGNDVTLLPMYPIPRARILGAVTCADAVTTVSEALRRQLVDMGADPNQVMTLRNGVDLERFHPVDGGALRTKLDLHGHVWLTVGHLIERKGVHLAIAACASVPDATLVVVGDGPERARLRALAKELDVAQRIHFVGEVAHDDLCAYYSATDVLVLASSREGMPNVVLESLACGTPVIAAPFQGVDELISAPEAGRIAEARSAPAIVAAWRRLSARRPARAATRAFAEQLGWGPVVDAQCELYARVLAARASGGAIAQQALP